MFFRSHKIKTRHNEYCTQMNVKLYSNVPFALNRLEIMQKLAEKRMKQSTAANLLQISIRQVKRLVSKYRHFGAAGLISNRRGKTSNRAAPREHQSALFGAHLSALP